MPDGHRLERAFGALCACSSAVHRAISEPQLLDALCRILVDSGGYRMAWVGYAEMDEQRSVSPRAFAGENDGYLEAIEVTWGDTETSRGPTGQAIRTGRPQLNRDTRTHADYAPWRELALRHGFASSLALPLHLDGATFGALMVYAAQPDAFDEEEHGLLVQFAEDLGFGIGALRAREALDQRDAQLRQAAKMEVVGQLTSGLIHDFNNLLSVISSCGAELTEALPEGSPEHETAQDVVAASARAMELSRKVLSLARAGVPSVRVQPLGPIVRELLPMLQRALGRGVRCELSLDPEDRAVAIDAGHVDQLLLNLAINARDAMPSGGSLQISLAPAAEIPAGALPTGRALGPAVELRVTDSGAGIPPDVRAHLFQPFFTTKAAGKGTGLGLAVVHGIVEHYRGRIAVESQPGAGATFRLFLPVA